MKGWGWWVAVGVSLGLVYLAALAFERWALTEADDLATDLSGRPLG